MNQSQLNRYITFRRRMQILKLFLLMAGLILSSFGNPPDPNAPVSSYSTFGSCQEQARGDEDRGQDYVAYECEGLDDLSIWLTFADSSRSYLGFGTRENVSGPYGLHRNPSWLVEWRGFFRVGDFEPYAVIIRMNRPDDGGEKDRAGLLFVYRLLDDGTSCLIGADIQANQVARDIADASITGFECIAEPMVPER